MCLHNPDCYIFHTRCRSCPLCQPVLACEMCLHNPDCYIFHTRCRSCPCASQFWHAKCACLIRTVIFFIQNGDLVAMSASFCMQNVFCIIRTVIFSYKVSILSLCQPVLACEMCLHNPDCYIFHTRGVDLVPISASFSMQNVLA